MERLGRHVVWREAALVLIVGAIQIGGTAAAARGQDAYGSLPVGGLLLLAIAVGALPLRLRHPVAAAWIAKLATLVYWSLALPRGPVFLALIITFGNVLLRGRRWHAVALAATGFVAFPWLGLLLGRHDRPSWSAIGALLTWLVILFSASEVVRARRDRARERARVRAEMAQRQVADERLRIARELHDVVAHNMSLINLQAGVALHLAGDAPPTVRESLEVIKTASKEALVELRSILGVLRHVDDDFASSGTDAATDGDGKAPPRVATGTSSHEQPASDTSRPRIGVQRPSRARDANEPDMTRPPEVNAPRQPTPGLDGLDDLLSRARAAGVETSACLDLDARDVPRAVQLAAYRIVQESLTNVARHANPPIAAVTVRAGDDMLVVDVVDEGSGEPTTHTMPSGGNGLAGMRERAASVGGELTAGPRLSGGFAVHARLPYEGSP